MRCIGTHPAGDDTEGAPLWCRLCGARILSAIGSLPGLAAGLWQMGHATGQLVAPSDLNGGRRATKIHAGTASPAWEAIDELVVWATSTEAELRAHLGHSSTERWKGGSTEQAAFVLGAAVRYLDEWATALLCAPFAGELWDVVAMAHRAERACGLDRHVERLTMACSGCEKPRLVRVDGSDLVRCRACGRVARQTDPREVFDTTG